MAKKKESNKIASKAPHWVEAFVVRFSLQNPGYGPQRLVPLLEQEGITLTTSAVYTILKRNNLQNKSLRLSKLEEQRAAEIVPEPADIIEPEAEEPPPVPPHTIEIKPESSESPSTKSHARFSGLRFRPFILPSLLVLGLVGYFFTSAVLELLRVGSEPVLEPQSAPTEAISKGEATMRPLEDYNIIYERNLFVASPEQTSASQEEVSLDDIPTAEKCLGLKLIGTVAGDDPATGFTIIENKSGRKQELYHEGDKAGEVLIKKILRNKVIVDAGRGEELLALELEETGRKIEFSPAPQSAVRERVPASREQSLRFDRAEVEASLRNVDQVI